MAFKNFRGIWNRTMRYVRGKAGRIGKPIPTDDKVIPRPISNPKSARRAARLNRGRAG